MRPKIFAWLLMVGLILTGYPSLAQMAQPPKAPPPQAEKAAVPAPQAEKATAPEPDPRQILQKMCDFLKSQQPVGRESVAHPAFSIISFPQRSSSVTVKKNVPPGTKARIFCGISQV